MPSYSGDRNNPGPDSWGNLVETVYGIHNGWNPQEANKITNWPLNYGPTGTYGYLDAGGLYRPLTGTWGYWWSITGYSDNYGLYGNAMATWTSSDSVGTYYSYRRGFGNAIRCVVRS